MIQNRGAAGYRSALHACLKQVNVMRGRNDKYERILQDQEEKF